MSDILYDIEILSVTVLAYGLTVINHEFISDQLYKF